MLRTRIDKYDTEHVVDRSCRGINLRNLTDKKLKTRNKKARLHGRIGVRRE